MKKAVHHCVPEIKPLCTVNTGEHADIAHKIETNRFNPLTKASFTLNTDTVNTAVIWDIY